MGTSKSSSDEPISDAKAVAAQLLELIDSVTHELRPNDSTLPTPTLDMTFDRDFGLDSLARVELAARVEKAFAVSLSEQAMAEVQTPRDVLRVVLKSAANTNGNISVDTIDVKLASLSAAPDNATSLLEMLSWHVERHPERPHIQLYDDYTDGEIITYGGLWQTALSVAGGLQSHGLLAGETVALMLPTGRDYFFAFFGVVLAGAIPVPIYPPVRRAQLEDHLRRQSAILKNCRASMLITIDSAKSVSHLLTSQVDTLRRIATVDELIALDRSAEITPRRADDIGFIQYTSGSTGDPKGVVLSNSNLLANIRANGHGLQVKSDDVFISWLPLYHDMGLIGAWLGSVYHAPRLVIMPPLSFLNKPQRWLWAVHRYGGTVSAAPNFAFELCLRRITDPDIEGLDLSHWRLIANGAEAISATTMDAFLERFSAYGLRKHAMLPVYGLAENSVGLTFSPVARGMLVDTVDRNKLANEGFAKPLPSDSPEALSRRIVGCGFPLPLHEVRVVDAANHELPERHAGSLQFRGPSATEGYYRNPDKTAALLRNGWLETGDLAYISAGEIFIVGREKDLIIRAGRNIYPTELEELIGDLDGIRKGGVAVIGAPDPKTGSERLVVLAETRKKQQSDHERLRTAINSVVTDIVSAPPDEVVLVAPNTILKTSSGKIRRLDCRRLYEQGRLNESDQAVWVQVLRLAMAGILPQLRRASRSVMQRAYAAYAWFAFTSFGVAAWITAMIPAPRRVVWATLRTITRCLAAVTVTRIEVNGHFPPSGQACVFVANHQSYLDGPILLSAIPHPVDFLVKGELQQSTLLRLPLQRLGVRFIERFDGQAGISQMSDTAKAIQNSHPLLVFPEGTFKRMPGVLPFHMGAFTTAVAANVPIVPIAIHGSRSMLRAGSWFPHAGEITITVGASRAPQKENDEWTQAIEMRDYARLHILEHCREPDLSHESNTVEVD
ncbi:MAG: 1-acyl-sn-glycerol-3-phosphate acyltransferase [Gammaproteobacteria bacterium]|jgi:1-acyl-sn-glycerol-3-phosphate acyltransferase